MTIHNQLFYLFTTALERFRIRHRAKQILRSPDRDYIWLDNNADFIVDLLAKDDGYIAWYTNRLKKCGVIVETKPPALVEWEKYHEGDAAFTLPTTPWPYELTDSSTDKLS